MVELFLFASFSGRFVVIWVVGPEKKVGGGGLVCSTLLCVSLRCAAVMIPRLLCDVCGAEAALVRGSAVILSLNHLSDLMHAGGALPYCFVQPEFLANTKREIH